MTTSKETAIHKEQKKNYTVKCRNHHQIDCHEQRTEKNYYERKKK